MTKQTSKPKAEVPDHLKGRCIHCGDTRKNHYPTGRCRTRQKDTRFDPWDSKRYEEHAQ